MFVEVVVCGPLGLCWSMYTMYMCTGYHVLKLVLLIWHVQATLHQMSCDRGRGYVPWEACGRRYMYIFPCHEYHYK